MLAATMLPASFAIRATGTGMPSGIAAAFRTKRNMGERATPAMGERGLCIGLGDAVFVSEYDEPSLTIEGVHDG